MMISPATKADIPALQALWKAAFGDEDSYIQHFFAHRFIPAQTLTLREDGQIASVVYLLNGAMQTAAGQFPAYYLYAAATADSHRRRGLMGTLLQAAADFAKEEGIACIALYPATEALQSYYARHGYLPVFETKQISLSRRQLSVLAQSSCTLQSTTFDSRQAFSLREKSLRGCDHFVWDAPALHYAIDTHQLFGANALFLQENETLCAYALWTETGHTAVINECVCMPDTFITLAAALLQNSAQEDFCFRQPMQFPLTTDTFTVSPGGMLLPLSERCREALSPRGAYLGLTLD